MNPVRIILRPWGEEFGVITVSAGANQAFRDGQWRINKESFVVVCIA